MKRCAFGARAGGWRRGARGAGRRGELATHRHLGHKQSNIHAERQRHHLLQRLQDCQRGVDGDVCIEVLARELMHAQNFRGGVVGHGSAHKRNDNVAAV